jgi:hypothetical protein
LESRAPAARLLTLIRGTGRREDMGVDHAWEKFSSEIRFALVSDASLQERLNGLISGVSHLQRDSFPDDHVWDEFRKLLNEVTKRGARFPEDEKIRATTSQMSDEKAKESLQAAFAIYTHLAKAFGRTEFVI